MPCVPFKLAPEKPFKATRTAKDIIKDVIGKMPQYGSDAADAFAKGEAWTKAVSLPEMNMFHRLADAYDSDWIKVQRDWYRGRKRTDEIKDYLGKTAKVVQHIVTQGEFGETQYRNLIDAAMDGFTKDEKGYFNHAYQNFKKEVLGKHPDLVRWMRGKANIWPTHNDLLRAGFTKERVTELSDDLLAAADVTSFIDQAIQGKVDPLRYVNQDNGPFSTAKMRERNLGKNGKPISKDPRLHPKHISKFLNHVRRMVNIAAEGVEDRYGEDVAEAMFSRDGIRGNVQVVEPHITGFYRDMFFGQHDIDGPAVIGAHGRNLMELGVDPTVAIREDIELRTNKNKARNQFHPDGTVKTKKNKKGETVALPPELRAEQAVTHLIRNGGLNMEHFMGSENSLALIESMRRTTGDLVNPYATATADDVQANKIYNRAMDPADPDALDVHMWDSVEGLQEGASVDRGTRIAAEWAMTAKAQHVFHMAEQFKRGELSELKKAELAQHIVDTDLMRRKVLTMRSNWGTEGRSLQRPITGPMTGIFGDNTRTMLEVVKDAESRQVGGRRRELVPDASEPFQLTPDQISKIDPDSIDPRPEGQIDKTAMERLGGEKGLAKMVEMLTSISRTEEDALKRLEVLNKLTKGSLSSEKGVFGMFKEWRFASMLSSLRTPVINTIGSTITAFGRQYAVMLGAKLTRNEDVFFRASKDLGRMHNELKHFWKYARLAYKEGPRLNPIRGHEALIRESAFDPESNPNLFNATHDDKGNPNWLFKAFKGLSKATKFPGDLLNAGDDALKQIQYRTAFTSEIADQLMKKGVDPTVAYEQAWDMMERNVKDGQAYSYQSMFDEGLKLAGENPDVVTPGQAQEFARVYADGNFDKALGAASDRALEISDQVAFQTPLKEGTIPHALQQASRNSLLGHIALPFVRTPTNIFGTAIEHFDLLGAGQVWWHKHVAKDLPNLDGNYRRIVDNMRSGDPAREAEAVGKLALGYGMVATVGMMYSQGLITGQGPEDPKKKKLWMDAGWRPESIKVGDDWVSYGRMEPVGGGLSMTAHMWELLAADDGRDEDASAGVMGAIVSALFTNLSNDTYVSTLADIFDAIEDPLNSHKVMGNLAGSILTPTIGADLARAMDPAEREARSIIEILAKRTPGWRNTLPLKRNVLGEEIPPIENLAHMGLGEESTTARWIGVINPISYSTVSDDVVNNELAALGRGFSSPSTTRGGVELRDLANEDTGQTAYDRWAELQGVVKLDGLTLKETLREIIKTPEYQSLVGESDDPSIEPPKVTLLRKAINQYRDAAYLKMLDEFPEAKTQTLDRMKRKAEMLLGVQVN